jgi:hypothetical protein
VNSLVTSFLSPTMAVVAINTKVEYFDVERPNLEQHDSMLCASHDRKTMVSYGLLDPFELVHPSFWAMINITSLSSPATLSILPAPAY